MILPAELIPSGQHDPLLKGLQRRPAGLHEVVLSRSAAERLKVAKGALIQASLSGYQARHERVRLDLRIVDVASERAFARPAVFASLEVLMAAEAFRDGRAVPALGWSGDPPLAEERVFPRFGSMPGPSTRSPGSLGAHGGRAARQDLGRRDRDREEHRSQSGALVLGHRGRRDGGFFPVARREPVGQHRSQAPRAVGPVPARVSRRGIMLYPSFHALFTAVLGWLGAVFVYLLLEQIINRMLAADLAPGQSICFLMPRHFLAALFLTLIASLLGAVLGGVRAARIEPSDGLREV